MLKFFYAQVATQRLRGAFGWELYMPILPFKPKGRIGLDIEHLDIHLGVQQSANVNKKPKLEILKLKLGNIQVEPMIRSRCAQKNRKFIIQRKLSKPWEKLCSAVLNKKNSTI